MLRKNPEFVVDFCVSPAQGSDIAFHFRVYANSVVVMNSLHKGGWREEEKSSSDPFVPGQPFELRFLVLENEYQVFVNHKSIYVFAHRLPPQSVRMLEPNPYRQSVSLSAGCVVKINADLMVRCGGLTEFVVDFCVSPVEGGDIAFHFRVYMNNVVVMNSFQEGGWREEKKASSDPFVPQQPFELRFLVQENEYQVFVNNKSTYTFAHRLPPHSVKMLEVRGDIVLTSVDVC
ncbi:galectin-10-like [Hippopotamus amphibius kiboko]|uniref:galectin-10-like n=1 Tax=Hippopotamus amphibius kiboko TaxID=575201 RepID=UPI0025965377|nr:galectin-10-like [Hippopotamus amphibius kiboko]